MPWFFRPWLVAALALAAPGIALAGPIDTPPILVSPADDDGLRCAVANRQDKSVGPLTITIYRSDGTVARQIEFGFIGPFSSAHISADTTQLDGSAQAWCRVEGKAVSPKRMGVVLCRVPPGSQACLAAVTAP